jgi:transposase-like protein
MDTRDLDRRAKLVARLRASGLSAREFGEQHGLRAAQLYSWSRSVREVAAADEVPSPFTEVRVREEPSSLRGPTRAIEVDIRGHVIRIPPGVDLELIEAVLAAVSRC